MFCEENGIKRQLSALRTLEQNDIAERRKRLLIKVTSDMLAKIDASKMFWREVVNRAVYIMNKV